MELTEERPQGLFDLVAFYDLDFMILRVDVSCSTGDDDSIVP